jgi:hypothetical protein
MAEFIDSAIESDLQTPGAEDVTAKYRNGPRKVEFDGGVYLRPTIVHCESFEHPLANREYLCPYASVVEVPQSEMLQRIGPSLVVTAITKDPAFTEQLLDSQLIERLNLGEIPTMKISWDQPHEGNMFEFSTAAVRSSAPEPMHSTGFDYQPRTRIVFGHDTLEQVGTLARDLGGKQVLLVTDPGIAAAGHPARAVTFLEAAGLHVEIYDQVRENPTTADVDRCVAIARECGADLLIGLGGGSSMDTAKGCNFILTNGGRMHDYWGIGKATKPMLPLIAIPTTAGTGSECQSFALISDEETHQKMACGDPKAAAKWQSSIRCSPSRSPRA